MSVLSASPEFISCKFFIIIKISSLKKSVCVECWPLFGDSHDDDELNSISKSNGNFFVVA